jgi:uncharacterized protein YvpB
MGSSQQLNKIYQVGLQLFKKGIKFYERYGSMNIVCDFFHPISLSHTLPNPKDTHKKVFGSHSSIVIHLLDDSNKFFPNPYRCSFLYASNSIAHTTFKRHQSSASTFDQS